MGVEGGILGVFGLLSGVPLVSLGRLLHAGGRNMVRILSEDDARDNLELDIVSFVESMKKPTSFQRFWRFRDVHNILKL